MDGKRTPLDGRQLKRYIASMREVVEAYKGVPLYHCTISIFDFDGYGKWWEISIYYLYYILYYNIIYNIKYKSLLGRGCENKISNGTMVHWYTIGQQRLSEYAQCRPLSTMLRLKGSKNSSFRHRAVTSSEVSQAGMRK